MTRADTFTIGDVAAAVRANILMLVALSLLGAGGGALAALRMKETFDATASLVLDPDLAAIISREPNTANPLNDQSTAATIVDTIGSRVVIMQALEQLEPETIAFLSEEGEVADRVAADLPSGSAEETAEALERQYLARFVSENLEARNNGRSFLIDVVHRAGAPEIASDVANAVVASYLTYRQEIRRGVYREILASVDAELSALRAELTAAEKTAQSMRDRVRLLADRAELLTGPQQEEIIAEGAELYARQREAERAADVMAQVFERLLLSQRTIQTRLTVPDLDVQIFATAVPDLRGSGVDIRPILVALGLLAGFLVGASVAVLRGRRGTEQGET